ncbi:MAG TPA: twin-arginine translocase TatA/TatE family subunit [Phycisphaerales bacterium]|nr:twin-arginine translocase TatA/TatE family subunit [Phycisphaerales bacterium]
MLHQQLMAGLTAPTLAIGMPQGSEWIILLILGLLIFGRRLPEVGKSLGKGIVEFKKGIKGIDDDIEEETTAKRERSAAQRKLEDQSSTRRTVSREAEDMDDAQHVTAARKEEPQ